MSNYQMQVYTPSSINHKTPSKTLKRNSNILCLFLIAITILLPTKKAKAEAEFFEEVLEIREKELETTIVVSYLKDPWITKNNVIPKADRLYPWKKNIMTTVFWIGEKRTNANPTPNDKSSWDKTWQRSYGGYDCPDPQNRIGFRPAGFVPKQNPFYIALPYNDINPYGTKPEAPHVIPWFKTQFEKNGKSVVKGRWIAIHYKGKVCYAQWEDSGPFRSDHWRYVFGSERPSYNKNNYAGLDISPAVRDYLGMNRNDSTDWKFIEAGEVPGGPWSKYGENNPFSPYYKQMQSIAVSQHNNNTAYQPPN